MFYIQSKLSDDLTHGNAIDLVVATNVLVEFLPGETNLSVFVEVLDDDLFEGDETVALALIGPSAGAQLGQTNTGTLLIVDDESKLDFELVATSVREYSNFVSLVVRRTGGTVNPVTVDYTIDDDIGDLKLKGPWLGGLVRF